MNKTQIKRLELIAQAGAKWIEEHGDNPESFKDFPSVAASVMQAEMLLVELQKETAGDAAVLKMFDDVDRLQLLRGIRLSGRVDQIAPDNAVNFKFLQ